MKAVELLGHPAGVNHEIAVRDGIFIKRDPRNVIVSWLRFNRDVVSPGKFLARFRRFTDRPLVAEMADYEGWLLGFVVRYEDLIASDAEMRRIAAHIGAPYVEGAWEQLENHTATWNAEKSDYRTVWTPDVAEAWYDEGGGELLTRWGYG
jgi:hypothetical protein